MRLEKEELNKIMEENNIDRIWSFSRVNNYLNCSHSYFLSYIIKTTQIPNVYSILGEASHSAIQDYIEGKIKYEDMVDVFEDKMLEVDILGLKFNSDEQKHKATYNKYKENMIHFFKNHKPILYDITVELPVTIRVGKHMFIGYIDAIHRDNEGNVHIQDYKSSTKYQNSKVKENGRQLLLYALGIHQKGVPIDKIKIKWNFMKYTNISFKQKNGKAKTIMSERNKIGSSLASYLRRDLKDNPNIDKLIEDAITFNTLEHLPHEIQNKYTFDDCYVDIPIDEEIIKELEKDLNFLVETIIAKEQGENQEESFNRPQLLDSETFFCSTLCGNKRSCKYYKQYTSKKFNSSKEEESDEDILNQILFG